MRIAVTGASGFIGARLSAGLEARGHQVIALGRTSGSRRWDPLAGPAPLEDTDAVVHLAGEPVAAGRWSDEKMRRIRDSRVTGTRNLVAGLRAGGPRVLVSASATGYYGDRGEEELTEDSAAGDDFLAGVCRDWEAEAARSGVRTVSIRIGIVLGAGGGALPRMLLPFRLGLGGRLGHGRQWMSWIHVDDLVALIQHALEKESLSGPLLGTSPGPVRNAD
ncbi:MAG TPA: TIGR01777 family oxidoreductase, partial [Planctomycetota bacterium]|nr:TIGR01777 family oxidoreductase [Planctomycetota bacterium]